MSIIQDVEALSRKQVRRAWYQILKTDLVGVPMEHIKPSRLVNPKGMSPLLYVTSASSERPPLTVRSKKSEFELDIFVLVLLADPTNALWTEEMAEDVLDDVEAQFPGLLVKYRSKSGLWASVDYADKTSVERLPLGGYDYLIEDIPLRFVHG